MSTDHDHELEDHDLGLEHDLSTLTRLGLARPDEVAPLAYDLAAVPVRRRQALKLFAGAGLVALVGCGSSKATSSGTTAGSTATTAGSSGATATTAGSTATTSGATTTSGSTTAASTDPSSAIPEETAGPYPGDGSNGANVLTKSGVVRSDIRSSLGTSTVATGVPFTIKLQIVKVGGAALAGAAVYVWHCDINGNYSMYSQAVVNETYLRGVQETDANGNVTFTSIFPACYSGRWPHVHYEVYPSVAKATASGNKIATSQLALPEAPCKLVFATTGYEQSVRNLAQVTLASDNVFSDGATRETPTMTGSAASGYTASLVVPVKA